MKSLLKLCLVLLFGLFAYQTQAQCNAAFTASQSGLSMTFTNNSSTTLLGSIMYSADWDFGDGSTSQNFSPNHYYVANGSYNVRLIFSVLDSTNNTVLCIDTVNQPITVNNTCGGSTMIFTQNQNAVSFMANPVAYSPNQISVTYDWDYGDGTTSLNQTSQSSTHTYLATGNYNACVVIKYSQGLFNLICADTVCVPVSITSIPASSCNAAFSSSITGQTVSFTNSSTNNYPAPVVINYSWNFGDGNNSTSQNPTHSYANGGTYNVCLVYEVRDSSSNTLLCFDTSCSSVTVSQPITGPCQALFSLFRDTLNTSSLGYYFSSAPSFTGNPIASIVSYAWDFGDGNTSTLANPVHTYATPGVYNVCLTITTSASCTDNYCLLLNVNPINTLQFSSILGTVVPAPSVGAMVYLIEYNSVTQSLYAVASTPTMNFANNNGAFNFSNITNGTYLVKAAYYSWDPAYSTHLPTYFNSSALWSSATNVVANQNTQAIVLNMLAGTPTAGLGFIGGSVITGANKTTGVGDPKHKLNVLLLDVATNQFVAVSRTDVNGDYSFGGLPIGTYKVFLEELGKTMTEADVVITASQTSFPNIDFESNSTENHPLWATSTSNLSVDKIAYSLSQNPVSYEFSINGLSGNEALTIYDLSGKVLKEFTSVKEGEKLNIADLSNGIYLININNDGIYQNMKMVIAR